MKQPSNMVLVLVKIGNLTWILSKTPFSEINQQTINYEHLRMSFIA